MPNDNARDAAERLDALWDQFVAGDTTQPDDDAVAFIAALHHRTPHLSDPARERIRHRLFAPTEGAIASMTASVVSSPERGDLIAPIPNQPRSVLARRRLFDQLFMRVAAIAVLALSLIGSWAAFRDDGDGPLRGVTYFPAGHFSDVDSTPEPAISQPIDGPMIWGVVPIDLVLPEEETGVRLILNEVKMEVGSSWSVPYQSSALFYVRSGEMKIVDEAGGEITTLTAGNLTSFGPETALTLSNSGDEPVEFLHGIVLLTNPPESHLTADDGVTLEAIATGNLVASGPISASLAMERIVSNGTTTIVHGQFVDTRLYAVLSGSVAITRLAGPIDVQRSGEDPMNVSTLEAIGDRIELGAGDSFIARADSSYRIESTGPEPAQIAGIFVQTKLAAEPVASPVATPLPAADRRSGSLIPVVPDDCTVEPRSLDAFAAILDDPYVNGTPVATLFADSAAGVPADDETIAGVTDTIVQIVACNSPASVEMYSLYSANALGFQAIHGMTIEEIESLPSFEPGEYPDRVLGHVIVEDVTLLPDGRVTAMVSANGEIAFVTFVFESGRWLIDFWDDSFED